MSRVSRRDLLRSLGAVALASVGLGVRPEKALAREAEAERAVRVPPGWDYPTALKLPFAHGVASGDPLARRVILWTRLTAPGVPASERVPVRWSVAKDPEMRRVVAGGSVSTGAEQDWTVKVDATGLRPAKTYYYRFEALGARSVVGRTRTAPAGDVDELRIAVVACSSYWSAHFNGYGRIADRDDLDLVVHCGDHVYDYPDREEWVRARNGKFDPEYVDFRTWRSLDEIRRRYALYYSDPDMLRMHRQHPISIIWDNHDLDAGDGATREEAIRAFWEWTPTRPPEPDGSGHFGRPARKQVVPTDPSLLYRRLSYGPMADLFFLDTRHIGRDPESVPFDERRLIGGRQFQWLTEGMEDSARRGRRWRLVVNQVFLAPMRLANPPAEYALPYPSEVREGTVINPVQWDGYPRERREWFEFLRAREVSDNLVLTGDMHMNWCSDLVEDPSAPGYEPATGGGTLGSVGVEFAPSSIGRGGADETVQGQAYDARYGDGPINREAFESPEMVEAGIAGSRALEAGISSSNQNVRYMDWVEHGYGIVHLTAEEAVLEYWWQDILNRTGEERLGHAMRVPRGSDHAVESPEALPTRGARAARPAP